MTMNDDHEPSIPSHCWLGGMEIGDAVLLESAAASAQDSVSARSALGNSMIRSRDEGMSGD